MLIFSFHLRNGAAVEGPPPREVGAYAGGVRARILLAIKLF